MHYLVFKTDLFFTDIPDDQLDQWFIGADCGGWMYARLLPNPEIKQYLSPTMEDWGWTMAVKTNDIVVEIYIWEHLDHRNHWILGIDGKKKFLKRTDPSLIRAAEQTVEAALNAIVESDTRFSSVNWCDENPIEKPSKSPE